MKTKLLLCEDDCAPDAREYFEKEMKNKFNISFQDIMEKGTLITSDELTMEWRFQDYVLSYSADDPFYQLNRIMEDSPNE